MDDTTLKCTRAGAVALIRESVLDLDPDREDHYWSLIHHPWRFAGQDPYDFRAYWREIVRMIEGGEIDEILAPGLGWIKLEAEKVPAPRNPWAAPAPAPALCSECGGSGVIDLLVSTVACVCTDAFAGIDRGVALDLPPQHPMCRCITVVPEPEPSRRTLADVARAWGDRSTATTPDDAAIARQAEAEPAIALEPAPVGVWKPYTPDELSEARASLHAMMLRGIDTEPETGTETGTGTGTGTGTEPEPEPKPKPEPAARPSLMEALAKGRTP